ncbi:MAG: cell division protein SepF, partial [Streptococcus sp.]|nr:cell division protein SepF [Streptococcus sp.]
MAIKDAIDKIVSYFDTDEVTDYEDAAKEEAKERPVKVQKTGHTPPPRQQRKPERPQATVPPRRQHINSDVQETQ